MTSWQIKRIYDDPAASDGYRVLVDRVWPRGIKKVDAELDEWCRDVAPSNELRKSFGHVPERYPDFKKKYTAELDASGAALELAQRLSKHTKITLLYSAKDTEHNQAVVLQALQK